MGSGFVGGLPRGEAASRGRRQESLETRVGFRKLGETPVWRCPWLEGGCGQIGHSGSQHLTGITWEGDGSVETEPVRRDICKSSLRPPLLSFFVLTDSPGSP